MFGSVYAAEMTVAGEDALRRQSDLLDGLSIWGL
jgi:hypothetical protein